jgi:TfoX/Sxy family transcriptional regulator of competence genes
MASQQATVDAIVFCASGAGDVSARKMFGEYALYCDGKVVALICNDQLFIKPTTAGRRIAYSGAKPSLLIPRERWEDGVWLSGLVRASADELPPPKPKARKSKIA